MTYVNAVTMVRDEADIIGATVTHMCEQVDRVLVADNGSVDGTWEILQRLVGRFGNLSVTRDDDPAYYQSTKMTRLAKSMMNDASWIVPFDADELWLARSGMKLRDALRELPADVLIAEADLWDHVTTAQDDDTADPLQRIGWRRRDPAALPKVAVRARHDVTIAQGNHSATFDRVDLPGTVSNLLTIRHFPYRSPGQTIRKIRNGAAAYALTDLPEEQGAHWRGWGRILEEQGEDAIVALYRKWHWRADPSRGLVIDGERQPPLVFDPVPIG